MNIQCSLCCQSYDKQQHLPRILIQCGHTLCELCLRNILKTDSVFDCPECDTVIIVEQDKLESQEQIEQAIMRFPKNIALINIQEYGQLNLKNNQSKSDQIKTQQTQQSSSGLQNTSSNGSAIHLSRDDKSKNTTNSVEIKSQDIDSDDEQFQNSISNNEINLEEDDLLGLHTQELLSKRNPSKNASGSSKISKEQKHQKSQNSSQNYQCPTHQKKIKAYCATDKSLLCIDCIVLTDNHKAHEIIATNKAYQQEFKNLIEQNDQALFLRDKLVNMQLDIESHVDDLNSKANDLRKEITEIYTRIRKLLQNRETELKKDISSKLENEQIRLKHITRNIKQQMKLIDKFQTDYSKSQNENETEFLAKVNKREMKSRNALQEIQNIDYPRVFSEFVEKDELSKISKLITCRKANKQAQSIVGGNEKAPHIPLTHTVNMSLTMSSSLKAQLKSNKKSNAYQPQKVNKINLITTDPLTQTQQLPCTTLSIASLRSRSKDKNEILFKSTNLMRKSPQIYNSNHQMSQQMSQSVSAFKVDLHQTQSIEFSPNQDCEFSYKPLLQKVSQSQNERISNQIQSPSDTSTEREYYQSHLKLTQQKSNEINNQIYQQANQVKVSNTHGHSIDQNQDQNMNQSTISNHYTSTIINLNNTLNSSSHQMFGKKTSSNLRSKKDSYTTAVGMNQSYSNQNSAKKNIQKPQKLISTTINLKDLVSDTSRCGFERSINSQRDNQLNNQNKQQQISSRLILDQKRLNSSSKKNSQNKPPQFTQSQSLLKQKQNSRQLTQNLDKNQNIENNCKIQPLLRTTLPHFAEININSNKVSNNIRSQVKITHSENNSEFDGTFVDEEIDESHVVKQEYIKNNRNRDIHEYKSFSTNQNVQKYSNHNASENRLDKISKRDELGKQKPYNEDFFSHKHQKSHSNRNQNAQRCSTTIKKATECNVQELNHYSINPTPKQLNFSEWENLKILQCNLDVTGNDSSQMITNSMIQNDNYNSLKYGQEHQNQYDLLNQLYHKTEPFLYSISGYQESPLNSIEKYDLQRGIWTEIQGAMTIPRTKFQSVVCQNLDQQNEPLVYILGGKQFNGQRTDTIEVFNPRTGDVKLIQQRLPKPRSGFAAVCVGNQILMIGGNDGNVLNKVDAFDLDTKEWKKLPSLNQARDELAVALGPDMKIYAVGGYGYPDNNCLNSAERFDPAIGKWEILPPMNECRRSLTLVALPDGIYAIGGYNGKNYLSSVEKYDESRKEWVIVSSMNNERCTLSAVPSPDFQYIYVLGGFNGKPLNVVERYSILNDVWEFVTPMKRARFMHSCCFANVASQFNMNQNSISSPSSNSNMIFDQDDFE